MCKYNNYCGTAKKRIAHIHVSISFLVHELCANIPSELIICFLLLNI